MKCGKCRKARRYAIGSMYCTLYGIIISKTHEGTREGCKDEDGYEDLPAEEQETGNIFGLGEEWPED